MVKVLTFTFSVWYAENVQNIQEMMHRWNLS